MVSSATLTKGEIIIINPLGLIGKYKSIRLEEQEHKKLQQYKVPDTFTFFGSWPCQNISDQEELPVHDSPQAEQ